MVVSETRQILANESIAMVFWLKGFFYLPTFRLFVWLQKRAMGRKKMVCLLSSRVIQWLKEKKSYKTEFV